MTEYLLHHGKITKQNQDASCHYRRQSGHEHLYKTLSVWKLLYYRIFYHLSKNKRKRITIVLSDWCFRFRKKTHWVVGIQHCFSPTWWYISQLWEILSAMRNSHNRLLMDFSSSKSNFNNPWLIAKIHKLTVIIGISMLDITRGWKNKL